MRLDLTLSILINSDDRLHGTRRNIVVRAEIEFIETGSYRKSVGNALLVGFAAVGPHMSLVYAKETKE